MGNLCLRKKDISSQPQYNIADENPISYTPATLDELEQKIKIESQEDNTSESLILNIDYNQGQITKGNKQAILQILKGFDYDTQKFITQGEMAEAELQKIKQQQCDDAILKFEDQPLTQNLQFQQKKKNILEDDIQQIQNVEEQANQNQRDKQKQKQMARQEQEDEKQRLKQIEEEGIRQEQETENLRQQKIEEERNNQEQETEKLRLKQIEEERIRQEQEDEQLKKQSLYQETVLQSQDIDPQQDKNKLKKYKITWSQGGKKIYITGSWLDWTEKIELVEINNNFEVELLIPIGIHELKFIVDDEWKFSDQYEYNGQNNQINV